MRITCSAAVMMVAFGGALVDPVFAQQTSPPLSGPKVEPEAPVRTLISRDMQGDLRPLETSPEEAALALLTLSANERAAVDRILQARASILDNVIRENLLLLLRAQGLASEGAAREDAMAALRELSKALAPLRQRGTLRGEVTLVLDKAHAAEFGALLDDYWQAVIDDALAKERQTNPRATASSVALRERLKAFGQEVRRSYDRQIAAGQAKVDAMIATLGLSPEQEGKVRNLVTDYFQKTAGNPTPAQRREFFAGLTRELTPTQRLALMDALYKPEPLILSDKPASDAPPADTEPEKK